MRTRLSLTALVLMFAMFNSSILFAQEQSETYAMAEITYMLPKIGMEKGFVDAINKHNEKYHKEGPFKASLDLILTGKESGWYVWVMGPCTFSDLDNMPESDAHSADWTKNVSPSIAKYGRSEFWKFNKELSRAPKTAPKYQTLWLLDIKDGEYYKFKEFMLKIKEVDEKNDGHISIYNNQFREDNGRDVAIVWPQNNWASFDEESNIKKNYEEIYGVGSWEDALKDWRSCVESIKRQVWKINVK